MPERGFCPFRLLGSVKKFRISEKTGSAAHLAAFHADRQFYKRLFEMPCRRATIKTRPPSVSTSAINAAFSCGVHCRRRATAISSSTPTTPSGPSRRAQLPSEPCFRPRLTVQAGKQDIGGHGVQVKEDYRMNCMEAVDEMVRRLYIRSSAAMSLAGAVTMHSHGGACSPRAIQVIDNSYQKHPAGDIASRFADVQRARFVP
jgi:hypothetical protein